MSSPFPGFEHGRFKSSGAEINFVRGGDGPSRTARPTTPITPSAPWRSTRSIGADPDYYLKSHLGTRHAGLEPFAPEALAEYLRCFRDPAAIHASCEDYRAAESIDLVHDEADLDRKIACSLLVLWGKYGAIERCFRPLENWAERAQDVRGSALPCGHYLPEEAPAELLAELLKFLA